MPFCPECKYEYVPGITECPDCGRKLVPKLHEKHEDEPEYEWVDLVTVASYPFEIEAQEAKIKLESHGIRATIFNGIIAQTDIILAFANGGVHVQVEKQDLARAREILSAKG